MRTVLALTAFVGATSAHLCVFQPLQRNSTGRAIASHPGHNDCFRRKGPCGINDPMAPVAHYRAGGNIEVIFQQNLNHYYPPRPGYIDVGISMLPDAPDWNNLTDTDFRTLVSFSDRPAHDMMAVVNFTVSVAAPVVPGRYVLRTRYVSLNPSEVSNGNPRGAFFQCSDIVIDPVQTVSVPVVSSLNAPLSVIAAELENQAIVARLRERAAAEASLHVSESGHTTVRSVADSAVAAVAAALGVTRAPLTAQVGSSCAVLPAAMLGTTEFPTTSSKNPVGRGYFYYNNTEKVRAAIYVDSQIETYTHHTSDHPPVYIRPPHDRDPAHCDIYSGNPYHTMAVGHNVGLFPMMRDFDGNIAWGIPDSSPLGDVYDMVFRTRYLYSPDHPIETCELTSHHRASGYWFLYGRPTDPTPTEPTHCKRGGGIMQKCHAMRPVWKEGDTD